MTNAAEDGEPCVCVDCVGDEYLKSEIEKGEERTCSYCNEKGLTLTLEDLSGYVLHALESHFRVTSNQPSGLQYALIKDSESDYEWERLGQHIAELIAEIVEVEEAVGEDIRQLLDDENWDKELAEMGEEQPFQADAHYEPVKPNDAELSAEWAGFETSLKTEARFFNRSGKAMLGLIFDDIATRKTNSGDSVVIEIGPGKPVSALWRARVFQSTDAVKLALANAEAEIGPPPSRFATAGRMNARGISVFYGATAQEVALAEVRPPVGGSVIVGKFDITRPLRVLNLPALRDVEVRGSIFESGFIRRLEHASFLGRLSGMLTMPVMPDDEPFSYLSTQAVADYLANEVEPPLDGIMFPSAQTSGDELNVTLFYSATRVINPDIPEGSDIEVYSMGWSDEDDYVDNAYSIHIVTPTAEESETLKRRLHEGIGSFGFELPNFGDDLRKPALKLDRPSLTVQRVTSVAFTATAEKVYERRSVKGETRDF